MILFTFLDNGIVLQVKSSCSRNSKTDYSVVPDWMHLVLANDVAIEKTFKFCQNGNCCSTGVLSFSESREHLSPWVKYSNSEQQKLRCKQNNYKANELGECGKFNFDFNSVENVMLPHYTLHGNLDGEQFNVSFVDSMMKMAADAWTPEWVKLVLGNEAVIKCSFEGRFDCKPEGKISFVLGILIRSN